MNLLRLGGDLRPLEVRYRAVRKRRFPGSHVAPRTVTFPLRSSDPGFKRLRTVRVKKAGLQLTLEPELGENLTTALTFVVAMGVSPHGSPFGYDLSLFQGGRRAARLRVSGRCRRTGGLVTCSRRRARVG